MNVLAFISRTAMVSCLSAAVAMNVALAQPAPKPFEPTVGQDGKDVIWVPTPQALVDKMLDMAKVTAADKVVDLGSGDGRTVITAAKRGATARGIEFNPKMVELSRYNAQQEGVADKATFENADIFKTDFSNADVVTMFLLTSLNARLRPTILDMKPGTRVVSNTFDMGEWKADEEAIVTEGCSSYCKAYFWIVPAKVDGVWTTDAGELNLKQTFQNFTGTLTSGNVVTPVTNGMLKGDQITFAAGAVEYTGKVSGATIAGTTRSGEAWQARRGGAPAATAQAPVPQPAQSASPGSAAPKAPEAADTTKPAPFEPTVGQQGKDVVWVPTPQALVDRMLDMAKLTPADIHYDLGSGDGRTVITAAKRGATAVGVEYNPKMVELSRANAAKEGVTDKATFIHGDIFETDFSKANVLTLFLLPDLNERLRPTILDMKPGTRVVSNSFAMGDWQPDERAEVTDDCKGYCRALLWIVPAKVDGVWTLDRGASTSALSLKQTYQTFAGTIANGNVVTPVTDGKLRGDQITFSAGGVTYTGKVDGDTIAGTTAAGEPWQAKRGAPSTPPQTKADAGDKPETRAPDAAAAGAEQPPFVPEVSQDGKDVVWWPTANTLVNKMLDMARLTPKDRLIDLGSGDGRTVIAAAQRGARALGIEYNPKMVELSKFNARKAGVDEKAAFRRADIFRTNFSGADVLTLFLLPELNERLRPTILRMRPGTRVVSNTFEMGDWEPDQIAEVEQDCQTYCKALLWIVPARVEGRWRMGRDTVTLRQKFQTFTGTIRRGRTVTPITEGRLNGNAITFTAGGTEYTGTVNGRVIQGTTKSGGKWQARRA